jgi:hypothetical protein
MNPRRAIAAITIFGAIIAGAQNVTEDPRPDPVLDAIQEFGKRDREKPNEVSVVLDPVGKPPAPVVPVAAPVEPPAHEESPAPAESPAPVLVTGKPPEIADLPPDVASGDGLAVRVEKLHTGSGTVDPAYVKLLAPFPAKPLAQPPAGWRLDASDSAPPFTREVELAPGSKITLTIRPHLLVPEADGADVFAIPEPGYDSPLGYQQTATVGAVLSNSIRRLEEDSKQLGTAIDSLQQLLISLPKPEPQPEPQPEAKPANLRKK